MITASYFNLIIIIHSNLENFSYLPIRPRDNYIPQIIGLRLEDNYFSRFYLDFKNNYSLSRVQPQLEKFYKQSFPIIYKEQNQKLKFDIKSKNKIIDNIKL